MIFSRISCVLLSILLAVSASLAFGQDHVKWSAKVLPADIRAGEGGQLVVTATLDPGFRLSTTDEPEELTSTKFTLSAPLKTTDDPVQPYAISQQDPKLKKTIGFFLGGVSFGIPMTVEKGSKAQLSSLVKVTYAVTDDKGTVTKGSAEVPVTATLQAGSARADRLDPVYDEPAQPSSYVDPETYEPAPAPTPSPEPATGENATKADYAKLTERGVGPFLWSAFIAGLLALLTPCVFPMIPVTVSYFTKHQSGNKYAGPSFYALGIISTFTVVGVVVALLTKGANAVKGGATKTDALQSFAAHPATNIAIGALFVVLSLSLFGVFELQMPSFLVDRANKGRTKAGWLGPFMMGLTFSLTSFTCTVGFVATLLATIAVTGQVWLPVLGMLVFSATFAAPFFLLALFPNAIAKLPRAGAWMATLKASMGFLELAAALKFFQNADATLQAGYLGRGVFLSIWSTIFILGGAFLLGWLVLPKFAGDSIGWFRRASGVAFVAVGVWFLTGIAGKSLGYFNSFLPVEDAHSSGEQWLSSYDLGLATAKSEGKNVLIDFTGYSCVNCRYMEANVFPLPSVKAEMDKMVKVRLYTDADTPESHANAKLMAQIGGSSPLPLYVILDPTGKLIAKTPFEPKESAYVAFLKKGSETPVARR